MTQKPIAGRIQVWADFHDPGNTVIRIVQPDGQVFFHSEFSWLKSAYARLTGESDVQRKIGNELRRDGHTFVGNL